MQILKQLWGFFSPAKQPIQELSPDVPLEEEQEDINTHGPMICFEYIPGTQKVQVYVDIADDMTPINATNIGTLFYMINSGLLISNCEESLKTIVQTCTPEEKMFIYNVAKAWNDIVEEHDSLMQPTDVFKLSPEYLQRKPQ